MLVFDAGALLTTPIAWLKSSLFPARPLRLTVALLMVSESPRAEVSNKVIIRPIPFHGVPELPEASIVLLRTTPEESVVPDGPSSVAPRVVAQATPVLSRYLM